ncbi:SGNH/GDSL hydrolase family protein [Mucilaginibacter sp. PAMB04168]|uniref:SGNH/GDSL hydrolase family protein n=1 Tax=Mucilaginibacter sp. PAMB04168 TaxID=3138567 RepID=UPI0031F6A375
MKLNNYKNIFLAGLLVLAACKPTVDVAPATSGSADFTTYIAVGDSQTAGYADDGLYRSGQINSFPNIIAQQLKAVGGGNFAQPLFSEAQASGSGYRNIISFNADGTPNITKVAGTAIRGANPITGGELYTKYAGDNSNYGIPGIKLTDAAGITAPGFPAYGNLNGYYERLLAASVPLANTPYLDYVTAKPYTFFTCWLGNNDALGYATAGGDIVKYPNSSLTDKSQFTTALTTVIERLTAGGKKGAVATIPDVSAIPFFNTVTIPALLAGAQKAVPTLTALWVRASKADGTYETRAATATDLVTLKFPTDRLATGYGFSPSNPIENEFILDPIEAARVRDYVNSYNQSINTIANNKGLAVFDAFTFLNALKQKGLLINGVNLSADFVRGGIFSLDGVHLTPKGYAIEANEFIKAINTKYGSNIPQADVNSFNSVIFPVK